MIGQSKKILTIGPDPHSRGGMCSVVAAYSRMFVPFRLVITYKDNKSKAGKVLLFIKAIFQTLYYCLFKDIKVLHIHSSNYTDFYRNTILLCIGKIFRKKVLLHIHGGKFDMFYHTYPRYVTVVCRLADTLVTVSSAFVKMLKDYDLNKRVYCLPNSIEFPDCFRDGQPHERLRLVFVGGINQRKGIYDVLECLQKYERELQDKVELHIGGVSYEEEYRKILNGHDFSPMVVQHGWLNKEGKEQLFCSSDVFIHPSHVESFGLSILEAMAYGLPVITTLVGGIPDFFEDRKSGVAVTPGNIDEIYEAILYFLNHPSDISQMGKYGRQVARQFSSQQVEERLDCIYKELLQNKRLN